MPNGTNASWPHRTDFVRATMAECERISNLTGGKPIIPQCNYQYFVSPLCSPLLLDLRMHLLKVSPVSHCD